MEWRHATGAEDREDSLDKYRGVRDDGERGVEPDKEVSRRAAEEVSSSESDEVDVEMTTEDEEELWLMVERDGFPREDTEVVVEAGWIPQGRRHRYDARSVVYTTTPKERYGRANNTKRRSRVSRTSERRR